MGLLWQTRQAFLAEDWSSVHALALVLMAGVALMWLVASWPLLVKAGLTAAAGLAIVALLLQQGYVTPDPSTERLGAAVAEFLHSLWTGIFGFLRWLRAGAGAALDSLTGAARGAYALLFSSPD